MTTLYIPLDNDRQAELTVPDELNTREYYDMLRWILDHKYNLIEVHIPPEFKVKGAATK